MRRLPALAIALTLCSTGCFLPVHIVRRTSPPVVGAFLRSDGTPATGMRVVLAHGYGKTACGSAKLRTTVDSAGTFALPGTTVEIHWIMVIPPVETFGSSYVLCAGTSDTTLHQAYRGFSSLSPEAPGDTVSCLQWDVQGNVRTTCAKSLEHTIVTGGHWTTPNGSGFYRLIPTEEGPLEGPDGNFKRPRIAVQWVEPATLGRPASVRDVVELPSAEKYPGLTGLKDPRLWESARGWCLSVQSNRFRFVGSGRGELWFELGPPGEVREVSTCGPREPNVR